MDITKHVVIRLVNELSLHREITLDDADLDLSNIGMSSLELVELIVLLEEAFDLTDLEDTLVYVMGNMTINTIVEALNRTCL